MPAPHPVYSELYEKNYSAWIMETNTEDSVVSELELFSQSVVNITKLGFRTIAQYIDIDYMLWMRWLLSPVIIAFVILPSIILAFIYISSIILYIYRAHRNRLINRIQGYVEQGDFWTAGREIVATLWDAHAWLWHGYELKGLENLPTDQGCMLLYYHGAIPLDYYYLVNRILLLKGILVNSVVDKFLMKLPGVKIIIDVFGCTAGTVESLADMMVEGKILGISPGGVYEAQFGDHYYNVIWRERLGFAKAAIRAKAPVVPVFTVNIREAFRTFPFFHNFWHWIFMKTRLPFRPLFGGFPIKLTTYIGPRIYIYCVYCLDLCLVGSQ
ncbi:transmembrane protein 68 isoform X2 [Eurytemora carolleeae]|uniref:transmembrane protein 68 isoform X2 n=1 Tax=Eurytemora carolleeae TaxID=1294199 RepID=UPI000C775A16|nr:transmembrane protein 68 isoform X2 [Eurytemora carolleeae]|eukprot:XP_023347030.1 transmembrane protein 68-like isoform X2 [Eurytemora affinis]